MKYAKVRLDTLQETDEELDESGGSDTDIKLHIEHQNVDTDDVEIDDDDHSGEEETSEGLRN